MRTTTDLFPEKVGQAKLATTITAQAKQANECNKKQDNVSDGYSDEGGHGGLGVGYQTALLHRDPCSAELRTK